MVHKSSRTTPVAGVERSRGRVPGLQHPGQRRTVPANRSPHDVRTATTAHMVRGKPPDRRNQHTHAALPWRRHVVTNMHPRPRSCSVRSAWRAVRGHAWGYAAQRQCHTSNRSHYYHPNMYERASSAVFTARVTHSTVCNRGTSGWRVRRNGVTAKTRCPAKRGGPRSQGPEAALGHPSGRKAVDATGNARLSMPMGNLSNGRPGGGEGGERLGSPHAPPRVPRKT